MDIPMIRKPTRAENYMYFNNMVCMIKSLEGDYTTIDLRDESCVTGKILHVDAYMNIELEDCYFYNSRGTEHPFEAFFVKGRNIRYVHIPPKKNALQLIQSNLMSMRISHKPTKKLTYKKKRALKYQKEIVADILKS